MADAKSTVLKVAAELLGDKDLSAIDRWLAADYKQHSPTAGDGPEPLRELIASVPEGFRHEVHRVVADGDMVALHATYHGVGPVPLVAFDVFRVDENGKVAEHWDALTPRVADTVSGRSQTDGPTEITDLDRTDANRALVTEFAERVLVGGDHSALADYVADDCRQHTPEAADGRDGFAAAAAKWAEQGKSLVHKKVHHVIAEGDFALVMSEGEFGEPAALYSLFRVADGKIAEHWGIVMPVPADMPHGNGLF
ncbi:nuclear transport factor 2 family protein [Streptomyces sp. NPDC002643]